MGAALARKYRNNEYKVNYPVPTLTLSGELDGLFRIFRIAESFYHSQKLGNIIFIYIYIIIRIIKRIKYFYSIQYKGLIFL